MEHNTLQGVIFDLDGTLLDSGSMWRQVDKKIMDYYGKEMPDDLSETVQRMSIEEFSRYFVEEFHLPVTPEQFAQQVAWRCHGDLRRTGRGGTETASCMGTAGISAHRAGGWCSQDPAPYLSAGGTEAAFGQTADRRGRGFSPRSAMCQGCRIFHRGGV